MEPSDQGGGKAAQAQLDTLDASVTVPTSKLDADQYSADDLDGITESLFGSGNMAYASLQASQTDAALAGNDSAYLPSDAVPDEGREPTLDTDRPIEESGATSGDALGAEGNFANTTVGSIGASTLSSDVGSFSPKSTLAIGGDSASSGSIFSDTGSAGARSNVSAPTLNNNPSVSNNSMEINDVNNDHSENVVDNHVSNINSEVNIVDNISFEEIVNNVNNETNIISENISDTINNITDAVNNIVENTIVGDVVENATEIINEINVDIVENISNVIDAVVGGDIYLDLGINVFDTSSVGLDIAVSDGIRGNLGIEGTTDNLSSLTESLTGLSIPSSSLLNADVGFDLLSGEAVNDGNDISIAGVDTPDIDLDVVENIVGDIDISVDAPVDLLDGDALTDAVGDTVSSLSDLDIADAGDALDTLSGEGIDGTLDAVIGDNAFSEDFDVSAGDLTEDATGLLEDILETVSDAASELTDGGSEEVTDIAESLAGDVDAILAPETGVADELVGADDIVDGDAVEDVSEIVASIADEGDVDDVLDLLNDAGNAEDLFDDVSGDDGSWTESTLGDGGLFDDIAGGGDSAGDVLPDPSGTIGEGLGILDMEPDTSGGGLGGLFG